MVGSGEVFVLRRLGIPTVRNTIWACCHIVKELWLHCWNKVSILAAPQGCIGIIGSPFPFKSPEHGISSGVGPPFPRGQRI